MRINGLTNPYAQKNQYLQKSTANNTINKYANSPVINPQLAFKGLGKYEEFVAEGTTNFVKHFIPNYLDKVAAELAGAKVVVPRSVSVADECGTFSFIMREIKKLLPHQGYAEIRAHEVNNNMWINYHLKPGSAYFKDGEAYLEKTGKRQVMVINHFDNIFEDPASIVDFKKCIMDDKFQSTFTLVASTRKNLNELELCKSSLAELNLPTEKEKEIREAADFIKNEYFALNYKVPSARTKMYLGLQDLETFKMTGGNDCFDLGTGQRGVLDGFGN